MAAETKVSLRLSEQTFHFLKSESPHILGCVLQAEVGLATEQAKDAVVSAQEYVKLKVRELEQLKADIERTRSSASAEEKAASAATFHEKVMIIQHEIAQTVEHANAGVQRVKTTCS